MQEIEFLELNKETTIVSFLDNNFTNKKIIV